MAKIPLSKLVLRCYGHKVRRGRWYGCCLDLNLAVEAETVKEMKIKLNDVISSYIDSAPDTDDPKSIPLLLSRRAPLIDWAKYYLIRLMRSINNIPGQTTFKVLRY